MMTMMLISTLATAPPMLLIPPRIIMLARLHSTRAPTPRKTGKSFFSPTRLVIMMFAFVLGLLCTARTSRRCGLFWSCLLVAPGYSRVLYYQTVPEST